MGIDDLKDNLKDQKQKHQNEQEGINKWQKITRDRREEGNDAAAEHARHRLDAIRKKLAWTVKRLTTLRKKIKDAKEKAKTADPEFESWMLNGCPADITDAVKNAIARAVVQFDLTITATTNGTHTAGSLHYSGRAVDAASWTDSRMTNFQLEEWNRGGQTELIGPTNNQIILGGSRTSLAEGSYLEQMHDNHVHVGY